MNNINLKYILPRVFSSVRNSEQITRSDVWLKDIQFERGQLYLLEACSGTGKSSLCSYIYGYRQDYEGQITIDGKDISHISTKELVNVRKQELSILWQELRLFPELTAMENVIIKNKLTSYQPQRQIDEWFEMLGIADRKNYKIGRMSFGQQQRVAMIRALCQPFSFLFADEPISHLDANNSQIMAKIMMEEAHKQGAGVIITSIGKHMSLDYDKAIHL
ncbi:MAG: ATP-binding cassette domain-containing protein [Bacteroidaceae bacterium]|nr:ATP-binding cassette domain-containing protein [Bacteroidaceae bacterium]